MYIHQRGCGARLFSQGETIEISGISQELAIVILVISVLSYALVNSIEIAIVALSRIRVRHLVEQGSAAARAIQRLQASQEKFFAFIVLLQNLSVVTASAMGGVIAVGAVGGVWGFSLGRVGVACGIALLGEVTPKVLAAHAGDRYPLLVARPVEAVMWLMRTVVEVMAAAPGLLSRLLFGSRTGVTHTVTEAELRMLIDIGAAEGVVEQVEAELLGGAFHFGDPRVDGVMVPRTGVVWLGKGMKSGDLYRIFSERPHSRFRLCEDTPPSVGAISGIKDVLRGLAERELEE